MEIAEDVPNARARNRLQCATALPHPEGHFQILSTPPVHLLVVAANVPEVIARYRKQPTRHRRTVRGTDLQILLRTFALLALPLALRHIMPIKVAVPGESTNLEVEAKLQIEC